jgi:hypothetical protein
MNVVLVCSSFRGHQVIPFDANDIYTVMKLMISFTDRSEAKGSEATMFKPEFSRLQKPQPAFHDPT